MKYRIGSIGGVTADIVAAMGGGGGSGLLQSVNSIAPGASAPPAGAMAPPIGSGSFTPLKAEHTGSTVAQDQIGICGAAAQAAARGSPAAAGLGVQCLALRQANIAAGRFFTDAYVVDPALRVAITDAGEGVIAKSAQLQAQRASLPLQHRRGFTMGTAVRSGQVDAGYLTFVRSGMGADDAAGFAIGLSGGGGAIKQAGDSSASDGGIPRAVLIGGGVVGVLAIAAAIYKFTR